MIRGFLLVLVLVGLVGCRGGGLGFEAPTVTVSSFRLLPSETIVPRFEVGLHIINPNRTELRLRGMSYDIELEGHRVLTGVSNQLPVIAAYGSGDVLLQISPDIINSLVLFSELLNQPRESLDFKVDARIDVSGRLRRVHVVRSGRVPLTGLRR